MTKEESMKVAFKIISLAGDASSKFSMAVKEAENNNFEEAEKLYKEAKKSSTEAHVQQTELLHGEARGEVTEYSLIMVHAQDHLMNANLFGDICESFIKLHKKVSGVS